MYSQAGFGLNAPLNLEVAQAQLERCAEIADQTHTVELAVIEYPVTQIISLTTYDNPEANCGIRQEVTVPSSNVMYHFRRHVDVPPGTPQHEINYPRAVSSEVFHSLGKLISFKNFQLTAIHVAAEPLHKKAGLAIGSLPVPDISIVGAFNPRERGLVMPFLEATKARPNKNHFMGNKVYDIAMESSEGTQIVHFRPFALSYKGN